MLFTLRLERKEKRMPEGPDLGLQGCGPQLQGPGVAARGLGGGRFGTLWDSALA